MRNLTCYDQEQWVVNVEGYLRREVRGPDGAWIRKDPNGVSIATEKAAVFANLTPKAMAEIEATRIRQIPNKKTGKQLEIFADPPHADSKHGNIVEIPYLSEDRDTAEFLAGELARKSVLIPEPEFKELKLTVAHTQQAG